MASIRKGVIRNSLVDDDSKDEYLHQTMRLASLLKGLGKEDKKIVKFMTDLSIKKFYGLVGKATPSEKARALLLLNYDAVQDGAIAGMDKAFVEGLNELQVYLERKNYCNPDNKHHLASAMKYIFASQYKQAIRLVEKNIKPYNGPVQLLNLNYDPRQINRVKEHIKLEKIFPKSLSSFGFLNNESISKKIMTQNDDFSVSFTWPKGKNVVSAIFNGFYSQALMHGYKDIFFIKKDAHGNVDGISMNEVFDKEQGEGHYDTVIRFGRGKHETRVYFGGGTKDHILRGEKIDKYAGEDGGVYELLRIPVIGPPQHKDYSSVLERVLKKEDAILVRAMLREYVLSKAGIKDMIKSGFYMPGNKEMQQRVKENKKKAVEFEKTKQKLLENKDFKLLNDDSDLRNIKFDFNEDGAYFVQEFKTRGSRVDKYTLVFFDLKESKKRILDGIRNKKREDKVYVINIYDTEERFKSPVLLELGTDIYKQSTKEFRRFLFRKKATETGFFNNLIDKYNPFYATLDVYKDKKIISSYDRMKK